MSKEQPVSKRAAIRRYLTKHPDAMPKEVAREVGKRLGVDVTRQYVTNIKSGTRWDHIPKRR